MIQSQNWEKSVSLQIEEHFYFCFFCFLFNMFPFLPPNLSECYFSRCHMPFDSTEPALAVFNEHYFQMLTFEILHCCDLQVCPRAYVLVFILNTDDGPARHQGL